MILTRERVNETDLPGWLAASFASRFVYQNRLQWRGPGAMDRRSGDIAKIAALCVLLLSAGGLTWWNFRGESVQPDTVEYVCAKTGKLYRLPRDGKAHELPLINPDTQERTLIPVSRTEQGEYRISARRIQTVKRMGDLNRVIDLTTLKVQVVSS